LRTKEQLGYVVFSGVRSGSTTYGFRFLIQSEKTCQYLESRIEGFLSGYADTLENISDADFESHKRSLVIKRLEKLKNLDQESGRHWNQICNEYFDFELAQQDAAHVKQLTKSDMIDFFEQYINPASPARAKIAVYLVAQATSDVSTKQISELVKTLDISADRASQAATDLQARLSAAGHDEEKEIKGLRNYLLHELNVAESKIDTAVEAWKALSKKKNGTVELDQDQEPPSLNGSKRVLIGNVRDFKAGLAATAGARPAKDLGEFEDLDSKL
ncbi:A-pheromone processing metallopeptidase Ste23, partial [Pleurostoma richardsiae]